MKLERIEIAAPRSYDNFKGYRGEITFNGSRGRVQIQVGDALSRRILRECAAEIVAASREIAEELTAEIIESVGEPPAAPALEAPAEGDAS